ncbi:type II toxin-antitoxin system VapC family toxin [Rhizobium sp. BE258]|uniref:type II toxin-antitoxin system VapC family toxin n=1 Tax=Rhizobium sp. BE258 TaxID=2817722 RepID=UPI00286168FE|nr:type II toxin-antitoxin system VapC family toxin [Rhizobium sp. BE258]MDR7142119.1 PIN domain nuclease of toxin-antitoxin system [Rhizobium sp. BE258]
MKLLVDTHILLWMSGMSWRLPQKARGLLENIENEVFFSTISIWEIAIKSSLPRFPDFSVDAEKLRRTLIDQGYLELPLMGEHAVAVGELPHIHGDPFDRILIAQSLVEGLSLITVDKTVARYGGLIQLV